MIREAVGRYEELGGASAEQKRVLRDLARCRTAELGGHQKVCPACGHAEEISYNSCRNRHCPKCQATARARWMEERARDLLPVPYFHVVFTLPDEIGPLARSNRRVVYGLFFRAVSETLLTLTRDPKRLGAQIGFLALLHTWGQKLQLHPHLHCLIPAGGLSPDGRRWIPPPNPRFFLPVRVLGRMFRGKFLAFLHQAHEQGRLQGQGTIPCLQDASTWAAWLQQRQAQDWIVYAKPPFGGPERVLKYLARYVHRVAISNQRLLSLHDGKVSFRWKDYAHGNQHRILTLDTTEFLRRFLLHLLPSGFVHIRHFGWMANRVRRQRLPLIRELLGCETTGQGSEPTESESHPEPRSDAEPESQTEHRSNAELNRDIPHDDSLCSICGTGHLRWVPVPRPTRAHRPPRPAWDTS